MNFLISQMPEGAQVIIGTEAVSSDLNAEIVDVTWKKKQVLRQDKYEEVSAYVGSVLQKMAF